MSGDYKTNSEVIRDGLRLLQEKQADSKLQQLKQLLQEGEASGTPLSWDMNKFLGRIKSKSKSLSGKSLATPIWQTSAH